MKIVSNSINLEIDSKKEYVTITDVTESLTFANGNEILKVKMKDDTGYFLQYKGINYIAEKGVFKELPKNEVLDSKHLMESILSVVEDSYKKILKKYKEGLDGYSHIPNKYDENIYKPPFRIGKKQKRAILDANGLEFVILPDAISAEAYLHFLNS